MLAARISASRFSDILLRQNAPPGGVLTLLDQTPVAIARTINEARFRGKPPSEDFRAAAPRRREHVALGHPGGHDVVCRMEPVAA